LDPITATSPTTLTAEPYSSPPAPSEAVSFCCWVHVAPLRVNTYAAPRPPLIHAPTIAVSPLMSTARPN